MRPSGAVTGSGGVRAAPVGRSLDAIFSPRSVAIVGATERSGSVGLTLAKNLSDGHGTFDLHFVNPRRPTVLGRRTLPDIASVPAPVDLAVIATPAATVPDLIGECARAGVRAAIIISAGFGERGGTEADLAERVLRAARSGNPPLRVIGPNCIGVAVPGWNLNATFAPRAAKPGSVAFLSQSGALCTAVLDWSLRENVGFSAFVSVGSMIDVGWADLIDYFGDDPHTKSIAIYMESVGDARAFLSAAREVSLSKPIVVIKAGRTAAAAKAVASHTGVLTGSDAVIDAAFARAGVLRVQSISELFDMVEVLDKQPRPAGPKLTIITNAGGPGVLSADALLCGGGELTSLSASTLKTLDAALPPHWSHGNPIDVLGDATPDRYARAARAALDDPGTDGLLAILTPQAMTDPTAAASALASIGRDSRKPILASWMGGADVAAGTDVLRAAGIPTFDFSDDAAKAFHYMWRHSANLQALYETVTLRSEVAALEARDSVGKLIAAARERGETVLSELASKRLLECYGIRCVETRPAETEDDAARVAQEIGFPVALKLHSETITHKRAAGGVRLHLHDAAQVRSAYQQIRAAVTRSAGAGHFLGVTVQPIVSGSGYELIIGSSSDTQFGPVMLFGMGGQFVEIVQDRTLALPPLNTTLARQAIERTRVGRVLAREHATGQIDLAGLEQLLVRFSQLVVEQKWIREIEINPLFAGREGLIALDARIVLYGRDVSERDVPRPAIRPYPADYAKTITTRDGREVLVRPIRPSDETLVVRFQQGLSERTIRYRYGGIMNLPCRTAHERMVRSCFVDFDRQIALVAIASDAGAGTEEIVAVARLIRTPGTDEAEFAVVVSDGWQGRGIGRQLLELLTAVAVKEGIRCVTATILSDNLPMLKVCERAGFTVTREDDGVSGDWHAERILTTESRMAQQEPMEVRHVR